MTYFHCKHCAYESDERISICPDCTNEAIGKLKEAGMKVTRASRTQSASFYVSGSCAHFDFCDLNFSYAQFRNASFTGCDFSRSHFENARLSNSVFKRCLLQKTDFNEVNANELKFVGSKLDDSSFIQARLKDMRLYDSTMLRADMRQSKLTSCAFFTVDMRFVDFCQAITEMLYVADSDLTGADLLSGMFTGALFHSCDFSHARMANGDFTNTDFTQSEMRGVDFRNANLKNAIFEFCALSQHDGGGIVTLDALGFSAIAVGGKIFVGCKAYSYSKWLEVYEDVCRERDVPASAVEMFRAWIETVSVYLENYQEEIEKRNEKQ